MKARKGLKWLAAGLVMAASMVLLGCPHNNLIEHDVVSGSGATSGRGSKGGVKLVITNFTDNSAGTNRANNAVLNPLRSIAPDHINLKDRGTVEKYVFVAEGESSGGQKYGPEYITVNDATGEAALGISGSGVWNVTVSAYEVSKLVGQPGITGATNAEIMAQTTDVSKVTDQKATALILQGKATLNLGMNASGAITVTLTNDGAGTDGNVKVTINFNAEDEAKINRNTGNDYSVVVGLYDYVTGDLVGLEDEIKPAGENLANPEITNIASIRKGRYQFRVTVKDELTGSNVAYWTDEIYVEGNRDVTQEITVSKLFETPNKPSKAGVYWSQKDSGETREGFLGYLTWEGMPFNAVGVDVQIANITKWYKYAQTDDKIDFTGLAPETITDATMLWQKIDDLVLAGGGSPAFTDVVTELKWSDVPQKANKLPAIYKDGSLLNGSSSIVFLMQTGQVYTVRIRAAGATDNSDWLIVDSTSSAALTKPKMLNNAIGNTGSLDANDFDATKLQKGIFDLVMLKYDLQGKYELAKTPDGVAKGPKAVASDLVVYKPYGTPITIDLKYNDMGAPQANDWFLYDLGSGPDLSGRSKGWKGWKGVQDTSKTFVHNTWGRYEGHSDLTLIPVGAGANVNVQAETAGTFNILTDSNILVDIVDTQGAGLTLDELDAGTHANGDVKTTGTGLADDAGQRYILSLDNAAKGGVGGTSSWLYVSVGSDASTVGTLEDANGNQFTVVDIEVQIVQNGVTVVKTFIKDSAVQAHAQLDGMASGSYTLKVNVLTSTGYWVSFNKPLAIKYNNQTI